MFHITEKEIEGILRDFGVFSPVRSVTELQRYDYGHGNVRLIVQAELTDAAPLVLRLKREPDVSLALVEQQCRFAQTLRQNGVLTPEQYSADGQLARWYSIGDYDVIVTAEEFVTGELRGIDATTAREAGALLAQTHCVSEKNDLHVENGVLFDPFAPNDLFEFDGFSSVGDSLSGEDRRLFDRIVHAYQQCLEALAPLRARPRFAVQGDFSDCNLYRNAQGRMGVFDYNRAGDNILFCDAVMQAVFMARLMTYPEPGPDHDEARLFSSFLEGYSALRPFSGQERQWLPYLTAIIHGFWRADIRWNEDSLLNVWRAGRTEDVRRWLRTIWERLSPAVS